jgi:hypothetical protein
MTTPTPSPGTAAADPELDSRRRAFDAVVRRMRTDATQAHLDDDLGNLLHQLYKLGELCRLRLGKQEFDTLLKSSDALRAARAAMWARKFDTHHLVRVKVATPPDTYTDIYHDIYGAVEWKPLAEPDDDDDRDKDYNRLLKGQSVLDTTSRAFDAMADLLQP